MAGTRQKNLPPNQSSAKPGSGRSLLQKAILLAALLWLPALVINGPAIAQVAFDVPERLEFAGIEIRLNPDAQSIVRQHGQTLVKNNKYYRSMTERADAYFPLIERMFQEEGVPPDFKYLAIQESGLTSDVISSSKAVGYWQFKEATATELGMRVDPDVDERMNIMASSRGAARYLKKNNQYLNNWVHALLSYYAGLGGARAILDPAEAGATRMTLDGSTHFYILKFLAHKLAFEQAVNRSPNPTLTVQEYTECEGKSLRQIASETNVPYDQVEFYNKWCRNGFVPVDRDYTVIIPVKDGERPAWASMTTRPTPQLGDNFKPWVETSFFGLVKKEAPAQPEAGSPLFFSWNGIKSVLARKEDNINRLALAAGITREELMKYNDLRIFDLIVPGQTYYVKAKRRRARVPYHTVRPGETLWEVAQNYGITLNALMRKNRMRSVEKVKPGRILWLRNIRPEDHPVEYDPNMPQAPVLPLSAPIAANPVAAAREKEQATASASTQTIITTPAFATPAGQYNRVEEKYQAMPEPKAQEEVNMAAGNTPGEESIFIAETKPVTLPPAAEKPKPEPPAERKPVTKTEKEITETTPTTASPAADPMATPRPEWRKGFKTHQVEAGQTLFAVSRLYACRADSLSAWNPEAAAGLKVGQWLYYKDVKYITPNPAGMKPIVAEKTANSAATTQAAPESEAPLKWNEYRVAPGDTFYSIAKKYNKTPAQIQLANNKTDFTLKPGEVLKVKF